MIVFKKMHFLRSLLPATMLMGFSDQPERRQLSLSAQKAVWATSIIKKISTADFPSSIRDPSLRDVILNLPDPSNEFEFQDEAKNEVMELFKDGVYLAKPFIGQLKISDAHQSGELPSNQTTSSPAQAPKKFIFFPNHTVTTPMFNQLMSFHRMPYIQRKNILITGGFGISKTVSIILFIHLSYHQTRFAYEALGDEERKKEYDKLIELGLMSNQVVKYWYWSAQPQTDDKRIIEQITEQAVELQPAVKEQLLKQTSLGEFIIKLRKHYNMQHFVQRVIVDQMNIIAALMREQNKKGQPSPTSKASQLCEFFKHILKLGENYILSTSVTIQNELLKKGCRGLTLYLIDEDRDLLNLHLPYEITLESQGGRIDFWQFFWFEFQRRIKQQGFNLISIEIAKNKFYKNLQGLNLSKLCCILYVRTFLSAHFSRFYKSVISQPQENARNEIRLFSDHCLEQSWIPLDIFMKEGDQKTKRQILKSALQVALMKLNQANQNQPFIIQMNLLENVVRANLQKQRFQLAKFLLETEHKGIIVSSVNKTVRFQWTIGQFVEFAKLREKSSIRIDQSKILKYKQSHVNLEFNILYYLREYLKAKGFMFVRSQDMKGKQVNGLFKIVETIVFLPEDSELRQEAEQKVQSFNGLLTHPGMSIHQKFVSAIEAAKSKPGIDILGLPFAMKEQNERIKLSQNNTAIDFLIVQYHKQVEKVYIWTFEVSIAEESDCQIEEVNKFHEKLLKDAKIKQSDVQLRHVILSSKYSMPMRKNQNKIKEVNNANKQNKKNKTEILPSILQASLEGLILWQGSSYQYYFFHLVSLNAVLASQVKQEKEKEKNRNLSKQEMKKMADQIMAQYITKWKTEQGAKLQEWEAKLKAEWEAKSEAEQKGKSEEQKK